MRSPPAASARSLRAPGLANPDNVAVLDDQNTLLIAEDTVGGHRNDVLWAYNLNNGSMTRILSSVYGAEITSVEPAMDTNINGWMYTVAVIQHPYGESDQTLVNTTLNSFSEGDDAYTGYFAWPTAATKNADISFAPIAVASTQSEQSKNPSTQTLTACPRPGPPPPVGCPPPSPKLSPPPPAPSPSPPAPKPSPKPKPAGRKLKL